LLQSVARLGQSFPLAINKRLKGTPEHSPSTSVVPLESTERLPILAQHEEGDLPTAVFAEENRQYSESTLEARKPLRKLEDLKWPPEPEPSLWNDPLNRDTPKPLRREELLAIGMFT